MRFQAAHKLVTYLLVLSSIAALATTRALGSASAAAFLAVCALSYFVDPGERAAAAVDRAGRWLRAVTGALLVLIVWRIWRRMPDADLAPAFDLVLAVLGYKLLFRRSHRDYVQIYALTLLLVLVASTVTATFLFVAAFALYVVLATWALILFHLRREMEENYLVRHSAQAPSQKVGIARILGSRRVVGRDFFGATFLVAVAVFLGAVTVFASVPRLGAGFVLGGHASVPVLGLADDVAIGRYGTAASARRSVVLRVVVPRIADLEDPAGQAAAAEQLYFRGAVYDVYEGGRWIRSRRPELRTVIEEVGRRTYVTEAGEPSIARASAGAASPDALAGAERQEVEAVGIPATALMAIDRPVAFELPAGRLGAAGTVRIAPRWSGEVALRIGGENPDALVTLAHAHYTAYSRAGGDALAPLDATVRRDDLEVPDGLPGLQALAARLGAAPDAPARITAIVAWLRAGHGYTATPATPPPGVDPVADFLFAETAGHCEYFASAAVLLLRATGVPARYVTGFRGGEWNPLGGYVAVRGERAHAWAEAFVPGRGWTRVDATPAVAGAPESNRLALVGDALDFLWNRWIVGYDLGRQRAILRRAWIGLGRPGGTSSLARAGEILGGALLLVGLGLLLRRVWRYLPRRADGRSAITVAVPRIEGSAPIERLYRRSVDRLRKRGWPRMINETPHEYLARLREAQVLESGGPFQELTDQYTAARFGSRPPDNRTTATLGRTVAAALAQVRRVH
ncbi:MAG TPA: transglutaminaseTgpA domain-containing protein [Polyangia bacterium]|nr:transglutaminaseTgpA domain-containing protein [Polyangia bacterium]